MDTDEARIRADFDRRTNLFAFDDHVEVVRADAAALEPGLPEHLDEQRIELREMRRSFDRRTSSSSSLTRARVFSSSSRYLPTSWTSMPR